jgi:hypothetical protein
MADSRKRKRERPVITIDRGEGPSTEIRNRNITITRQGGRLTKASTPVSAPSDQEKIIPDEPSPWCAEFYDEVHEDPPLPEVNENTQVRFFTVFFTPN